MRLIFQKVIIKCVVASWVVTVVSCSTAPQAVDKGKYDYLYAQLPIALPKVQMPVFPDREVNITDFGGKGDGITLNTQAFTSAIDKLSNAGGGTLQVPQGVWLTGPIVFKSNINLHLQKGALILFSANFDDYPLVETIFEGLDTKRCQSPISGRNLENVAITGEGSIDGSGQVWRPLKKQKVTEAQWNAQVQSGGIVVGGDYWFPSQKAVKGLEISDMNVPRNLQSDEEWNAVKDYLRPVMVNFIECNKVLLQGVLFQNSPSWNLHPLMCTNVILDGVTVRNPSYAQNGDGLDLESCKDAIIVNSTFDVGDDGICLKSGKDAQGRKRGRATENVVIDNCKVYKGHGGFVVGSEMSGGVRNIVLTNCSFLGTDVGLRFKSCRGRGGVVENIYVSNVSMVDIVTDSFLFDLFYSGKSAVEVLEDGSPTGVVQAFPAVSDETPVFRNIWFKNITSRNARRVMYFNGLPEMNIENINIENCSLTATYGAELVESKQINFKNISIGVTSGYPLILKNVKDFRIEGFNVDESIEKVVSVEGIQSQSIVLPQSFSKKVEVKDGVTITFQ